MLFADAAGQSRAAPWPAVNQTRRLIGDSERRAPNGPTRDLGLFDNLGTGLSPGLRVVILAISRKLQSGKELTAGVGVRG